MVQRQPLQPAPGLTRGQPSADELLPSRVHLIGIGGAGMAPLAVLLMELGCELTGSDLEESAAVRALRQQGVSIGVPHDARHLANPVAGQSSFRARSGPGALRPPELVVYSSAIPEDNVERRQAKARGIPAIKRAAMLGRLSRWKDTIAVAGTHGKTTTTAMLAWILKQAGCQPGWAVGGEVPDLGGSAQWGAGSWFVVEADEFDRSFLALYPRVAVINNIETDHLDYYGHPIAIYQAFAAFAARLPADGLLVIGEDAAAQRIAAGANCPVQAVGFARECDWQATHLALRQDGTECRVHAPEGEVAQCWLRVPGTHNVRNALAALACAAYAGVPLAAAAPALATFNGAARRFQRVGEAGGIIVYEDYAHHPSEIRAILAAARQVHPATLGRIWAIFEPHTYSRTEALFDDFAQAFRAADRVVLTDVYSPSGRGRASGERDSAALAAATSHPAVQHAATHRDALAYLVDRLVPGDCVVVMGAGPIYRLAYRLVDHLRRDTTPGT